MMNKGWASEPGTIKQEPEITRLMSEMLTETKALHEAITQHEDRIKSIVRNDVPNETEVNKKSEPLVEFAHALDELLDNFRRARYRISSLTERCEL